MNIGGLELACAMYESSKKSHERLRNTNNASSELFVLFFAGCLMVLQNPSGWHKHCAHQQARRC